MVLYVDLETYAASDLKKVGVYAYAEDPTFEIMMAAWSIDGDEPDVATGEDEIRLIPGLWDPEVIKVAHNAQFERICLANLGPTPVETWIDTMALAAEYGLPQGLDNLAKRLKVAPKDSAGTRLINLFCRPVKGKGRVFHHEHPEKWQEFLAYCLQDVRTLVLVAEKLGLEFPTKTEAQLFQVDQIINDRGVKIDVELAQRALEAGSNNAQNAARRLKEITGLDNPNSVQQLMPWLRDAGTPLPNLQAETVKEAIDDPDTGDLVREVLELRQGTALIAAKKFEVALNQMNTDGRLRGQFRFYGAHTGRWAGRGVQLHNLPRASISDPETAILDLKLGNGADAQTLKALVRSMITGPLTVCDYSAIEARVLAWLAGEEWVLEAFRGGRDIYVETAARMSTPGNEMTRFQGKVACVTEGSMVLTDKGLVAIEDVTTDHLMWDGKGWVEHDGVVYKGERDVIEYQGLRATPDHLVWIEGSSEPVHLGVASASCARLVQSGSGGSPIWVGGDSLFGEEMDAKLEWLLGEDTLYRMRVPDLDRSREPSIREVERLSELQPTEESEPQDLRCDERGSLSLSEPPRSVIQSLRRARYRVQVFIRGGSYRLGHEGAWTSDPWVLDRPDRQRRTLRTRKHPLGNSISANEQPETHGLEGVSSGALAVLGSHSSAKAHGRQDSSADHCGSASRSTGEAQGMANDRTTARVYDIVNSGPRQRFTVSNVLVHNCLALGYQGALKSLQALGAQGDDDELYTLVRQWRGANPAIVKFWKRMELGWDEGVRVRHINVKKSGSTTRLVLPSGRALTYRWVSNSSVLDTKTGKMTKTRTFSDAQGNRIDTYGGRLTENVTQAVARDILADALIRLEEEGIPVVGHVHDEVLAETEDLAAVQEIMCQPPEWAKDLPLNAEGFVTARYRKG